MSIESKISRLSLDLKQAKSSPLAAQTSAHKRPIKKTPDSWEDDVDSDDDDGGNDTPVEAPGPTLRPFTSKDEAPAPPPPTPISPTLNAIPRAEWSSTTSRYSSSTNSSRPGSSSDQRRPEKSTATANRMIAGALGVKAPKRTDEQRQYDRAVKEAEIKRKNREKEARELEKAQDEKAKAAMWDS